MLRGLSSGVGDGGYRLIGQAQLLPPAGKVQMDGGRHLPQALDEVGPVVDEQGPGLGHAQVELVQGVQQGGVLLPVPEYADLMLVEAAILRQGLGVLGPKLADTPVQEPPPGSRSLPDEVEVLRAEEHGVEHAGQLPGGLEAHPVGVELPPHPPAQTGLQGEVPPTADTSAFTKAWSTPNWMSSRSYRARWEEAVDR